MRTLPDVHLAGLSRLADAERWGESVARGLGRPAGTFTNTLGANRVATNELTLEGSPVAVTVIDLAIRCPFFRGTMQELLQTLARFCAHHRVPFGLPSCQGARKPCRSSSAKLAPQLRSIGIAVEFQRESINRFVTIAMKRRKG